MVARVFVSATKDKLVRIGFMHRGYMGAECKVVV
jgi:hypothetical protein